jgi:SNF2 family DNA or RNA helicase
MAHGTFIEDDAATISAFGADFDNRYAALFGTQTRQPVVWERDITSPDQYPTPIARVLAHYKLPFPLYKPQEDVVNKLGDYKAVGVYGRVGTGKTVMGTVLALNNKILRENQTIVTMPPILLEQWRKWLSNFPVSVTVYKGTPAQRQAKSLDADFILMSSAIFKKDFERLQEYFYYRTATLMRDEATDIKNSTSDNWRATLQFTKDHDLILLTGTPLSTPKDAYGYIKLIDPYAYGSYRQFESFHIAEVDPFGRVLKYKDAKLLQANFSKRSAEMFRSELLGYMPKVTYQVQPYDLAPDHVKLYKKLVDANLLEYEDGTKLDATSESRLHHSLQQIVMNWAHFAKDESKESAGVELLLETLDELGQGKLLVFCQYRMTIENLHKVLTEKKINAGVVYGGATEKVKDQYVERFKTQADFRVLLIQPQAGGFGLDGLQKVCADALFLELPQTTKDLEQCIGRLDRTGQENPVVVRVAVAHGTLQPKKIQDLIDKDAAVSRVQKSIKSLKAYLLGE